MVAFRGGIWIFVLLLSEKNRWGKLMKIRMKMRDKLYRGRLLTVMDLDVVEKRRLVGRQLVIASLILTANGYMAHI